jgi:hypothetical protein
MITISLPPDIEGPLTEEAQRQGTTPELLALDSLRKRFGPASSSEELTGENATLFDFLAGHIGMVEGSTEAFSDNCSQRFTDVLVEKQQRGRL